MKQSIKEEEILMDITENIIKYEDGVLTGWDVLELFSSIIGGGMLKEVGKEIRRTAEILMEKGMISPSGKILIPKDEVIQQFALNGKGGN